MITSQAKAAFCWYLDQKKDFVNSIAWQFICANMFRMNSVNVFRLLFVVLVVNTPINVHMNMVKNPVCTTHS